MKYYAIRQISTGLFMPRTERRRGFTRDEPSDKFPPRLFHKESSAKHALSWWLDGITVVSHRQDWEGGSSEDWDTIKKPERNKDDMEVVEVILSVRKIKK